MADMRPDVKAYLDVMAGFEGPSIVNLDPTVG